LGVTSVGKSFTEAVLLGVAQQQKKDDVFSKRGPKVNIEFESAVLARCMEFVVSKALQSSENLPTDDRKPGLTAEVLANVLYKYDMMVLAAQDELKEKRWDTNEAVKKCVILYILSQLCDFFFWLYLYSSLILHRFHRLRLSRFWVHLVLKRFRLTRQRVVNMAKPNRPDVPTVQKVMESIQQLIIAEFLELSDVWNADE
jgi:hypothetical protein